MWMSMAESMRRRRELNAARGSIGMRRIVPQIAPQVTVFIAAPGRRGDGGKRRWKVTVELTVKIDGGIDGERRR